MLSCKKCVFYEKAEDLNGGARHFCRLKPVTYTENMTDEEAEVTAFLADDLGCAQGRPENATCADCDHAHPLVYQGRTIQGHVECHLNPPTWIDHDFRYPFVKKTATCAHWQNLRMGEFDE